jgi:murein DD-endopeptidase MepM/ murein hydrolase activator NlpD
LAICETSSAGDEPWLRLPCTPSPHQTQEQTKAGPDLSPAAAAQSLLPTETPSPTVEFKLCSPLRGHPFEELPQIISDPYSSPPPRHEERHEGVDFSYYRRGGRTSILGVEVQSIFPGRVALSLVDKFPYGNFVIVETPYAVLPVELAKQLPLAPGESLYSLYAHMEEPPRVALGEPVEACQLLGKVGKSGNAGVAHLHLETRSGPPGQQFTSMEYYDIHATQEEKDNYLRWRISWDFKHFDPMLVLGSGLKFTQRLTQN